MEGNAAAGAVSSPHETIGNNVNPRTGTLSGGVSGFAAIVVRNTKTTILNGAQRTQASIHGHCAEGGSGNGITFQNNNIKEEQRWQEYSKKQC